MANTNKRSISIDLYLPHYSVPSRQFVISLFQHDCGAEAEPIQRPQHPYEARRQKHTTRVCGTTTHSLIDVRCRLREHVLGLVYPGQKSFAAFHYHKLPVYRYASLRFSACACVCSAQPIALARSHLSLFRLNLYWVAEKSDGTRIMALLQGGVLLYLIDRKFEFYALPGAAHGKQGDTLIDCESWSALTALPRESATPPIPTLLVFDVITARGTYYGAQRYEQRLAQIRPVLALITRPATFTVKAKLILKAADVRGILACILPPFGKPGTRLFYRESSSSGITCNYNDGLVFTPDDAQLPLLKWKPFEKQTIDLKIKPPYSRAAEGGVDLWSQANVAPGKAVEIIVKRTAVPAQRWRSLLNDMRGRLADDHIVECVYDGGAWELLHLRADKNTPNFLTTVVQTLEVQIDNIQHTDRSPLACMAVATRTASCPQSER